MQLLFIFCLPKMNSVKSLIILLLIRESNFLKCTTMRDCSYCGFCLYDLFVGNCYFPFQSFDDVVNGVCHSKQFCKEKVCKNQSKCFDGFGYQIAMCQCDINRFYGKYCENEIPKGLESKLANGFGVFFSYNTDELLSGAKRLIKISEDGEPIIYKLIFHFTTQYSGEDLNIDVSTSEGYEVTLRQSKSCDSFGRNRYFYPYKLLKDCKDDDNCHQILPKCRDIYIATLDFPYIYNQNNRTKFLKYDNLVYLGYLADINVVARNGLTTVFSHSFEVMINFHNLLYNVHSLVPNISIHDCAFHSKYSMSYYRGLPLMWVSTLKNNLPDATLYWSIYSMPEVYKVESYITTRKNWKIPPFRLNFGNYKLRLVVENVEKKVFSNFVDCYFKIRKQPLEVHLEGGNRRVVSVKEGIALSGAKSYDPNEPLENQTHISFLWTCSPDCSNIIDTFGKAIWVKPERLTIGKSYLFTLTVSAPELTPKSVSQEIVIADDTLSIECLTNCLNKVVPAEIVLLEARMSSKVKIACSFAWTYEIEGGNGVAQNVESIYDKTYPSNLLCIKPNSLLPGKTYYLNVSCSTSHASYKVIVDRTPYNGSCTVSPSSGIKSQTLFDISCLGFVHDDDILVYEYYNKHKFEVVERFNGRLLRTDFNGTLNNIKLSREIVVIFIYSLAGFPAFSIHNITLREEIKPTNKSIQSNLTEINMIAQNGNLYTALNQLDELIDTISILDDMDNNDVFSKCIDIIISDSIEPDTLPHLKIALLSLKSIIEAFASNKNFQSEPTTAKYLTMYMRNICKIFKSNLLQTNIPYFTRMIFKEVTAVIISVFELILEILHRLLSFLNKQIKIKLWTEINVKNVLQVEEFCQEIIEDITYSISLRQPKKEHNSLFTSISSLSLFTALTDSCLTAVARINSNKNVSIKLPMHLTNCFNETDSLTIQVGNLHTGSSLVHVEGKLSTNLKVVNIFKKISSPYESETSMKQVTLLPLPFDLHLEVKNTYNHGNVSLSITKLDLQLVNKDDLDNYIKVVRIDVPNRCKMFVQFRLESESDELMVTFQFELRPNYELMMESAKTINSSNTHEAPYEISNNNGNHFLYIGVLPGPSTPISTMVNFSIDYFCYSCLTRFHDTWVKNFCYVGHENSQSKIHCRCNHLSVFSGVFLVPPHEINPFYDLPLLLTVKDNPYIVVFIATSWLIFLILCVISLIIDKKQRAVRVVINLEDNFPGDNYLYIVAVFTGSRFMAGTNANVGIEINGIHGKSRVHILKARERKALKYNADDWFLISTPILLGELTHIHIWHDSSGHFSDWYCDKILVYDLNDFTVYTFFAEDWIALDNELYPEAVLRPATVNDFQSLGRIFLENLKHGITHCHLMAGIFSRQRDVKLSKLDRVVIIWATVMTASLIGIAFYHTDVIIDDPQFSMGTKTIIKGTQIFILNVFFIAFFQTIFKISYLLQDNGKDIPYKYFKAEDELTGFWETRDSSKEHTLSYSRSATFLTYLKPVKEKHMTSYQKFVQTIYKVYRPMTQLPVTLSGSSNYIKRRLGCYAFAWLSAVLAICICSFFVILYGLKMGKVKSWEWVTHIATALFNHFLVLVPLKIILVAVILSSHFVHLVPVSNYKIKSIESCKNIFTNDYSNVLEKRKSQAYCPLKLETADMKREKRKRISGIIKIVITLVLSLVIILLGFIRQQGDFYLDSNQHLTKMFQVNRPDIVRNFSEIDNSTQFVIYLMGTVIVLDTIYRKSWYNEDDLSPPYLQEMVSWTEDCTYQVIGVPVLRQLRVLPNTCSINVFLKDVINECIPAWSIKVQDTNKYEYMWIQSQDYSGQYSMTEWTYQTSTDSGMSYSDSVSGIDYPGGGYIANLSSSRYDSSVILLPMLEGRWLDQYTRVVFFDLVLYNVNTRMFSQVTLVAEHLPTGIYITNINVESTALSIRMILYCYVCIFVTGLLIMKTCISVHSYGAKKVVKLPKNMYLLLLTVLGILTVVFGLTHIRVASEYLSDVGKDHSMNVFNFFQIIRYQKISNNLSILFFAALLIQLFSMWNFGRVYLNSVFELRSMVESMIVVSVCLVIICYLHWKIFQFLNLFLFSRRDCGLRWSVTLSADRCFQDNAMNTMFYAISRMICVLFLIHILGQHKLVKYRSDG